MLPRFHEYCQDLLEHSNSCWRGPEWTCNPRPQKRVTYKACCPCKKKKCGCAKRLHEEIRVNHFGDFSNNEENPSVSSRKSISEPDEPVKLSGITKEDVDNAIKEWIGDFMNTLKTPFIPPPNFPISAKLHFVLHTVKDGFNHLQDFIEHLTNVLTLANNPKPSKPALKLLVGQQIAKHIEAHSEDDY